MDINVFRVSSNGDAIELWVEVPYGPRYKNIVIDKIAIQDQDHYTVSYPDNPQIELTKDNNIEDLNISDDKKVIKRLKFKDLGLLGLQCGGIYFMYIKSFGQPDECQPSISCSCHKDLEIAVTLNLLPIFNLAIKLINSNGVCEDNSNKLIDLYLKELMIKDAIYLQEYIQAINIWNDLLHNDLKQSNCLNSCNGCSSTNNINISSGCKNCGK